MFKLFVCITVVVVVVLALKKKKGGGSKGGRGVHQALDRADTIFVVCPVDGDAAAAARCLAQMFDAAARPDRVFVGVRDAGGGSTTREYTELMRETGRYSGNHQSQIRRVRSPGSKGSRYEIMASLYGDEGFILHTSENCWFLPGWDEMIIRSLHKTHLQGGHLVSAHAYEQIGDGGLSTLASLPATFPVFHQFSGEDGVPGFKGRFFVNEITPPTRIGVASVDCLFGSRGVLAKFLSPRDPRAESDFVLSTDLWARGYKVFNALSSPVIRVLRADRPKRTTLKPAVLAYVLRGQAPKNSNNKNSLGLLAMTPAASPLKYQQWLGIDAVKRTVSGRAVLGMLKQNTEIDVALKYGSQFRYSLAKDKIKQLLG
jgi:hypothetical protein